LLLLRRPYAASPLATAPPPLLPHPCRADLSAEAGTRGGRDGGVREAEARPKSSLPRGDASRQRPDLVRRQLSAVKAAGEGANGGRRELPENRSREGRGRPRRRQGTLTLAPPPPPPPSLPHLAPKKTTQEKAHQARAQVQPAAGGATRVEQRGRSVRRERAGARGGDGCQERCATEEESGQRGYLHFEDCVEATAGGENSTPWLLISKMQMLLKHLLESV
jgi:hypothetical protein